MSRILYLHKLQEQNSIPTQTVRTESLENISDTEDYGNYFPLVFLDRENKYSMMLITEKFKK